ncbi:hypothetical protein NDU88_000667 [Pleurodeles waltl]|uniref:Uncharacterized protein n=1 Tax=Pleurodeles waltl TaxID=8319 RepID=A0AAV7MKC5_PLEWA|nr:hypothetical protein NDU88_000667 [Pleurodeles waltl]
MQARLQGLLSTPRDWRNSLRDRLRQEGLVRCLEGVVLCRLAAGPCRVPPCPCAMEPAVVRKAPGETR